MEHRDSERTQSFISLKAGTDVAHYKIINMVGSGAMGDVYLADDSQLKRNVALKFLSSYLSRSPNAVTRFRREAQAVARFTHPNIVAVYDVGEYQGQPYIVYEYIDGSTMQDLIEDGPISIEQAVEFGLQICSGLESAHRAGVVHRDLKPANIVVDRYKQVHLIDFGLAAVQLEDQLTQPGHVVGTSGYMSPEQIAGRDIDRRSDIFSFGVLFYRLLTGKHPFLKETLSATMFAITSETPQPMTAHREEIPEQLQQIVDKALEKNRSHRYQHADEIYADLNRYLHGSGGLYKKRRRLSILSIVTSMLVVAVLLVVGLDDQFRDNLIKSIASDHRTMEMHLAVLPFVDLSENPTGRLLCNGLRETLTSSLTTMEQYKGSLFVVPAYEVTNREVASIKDARKAFKVSMVITGSVQQLGDRFRLSLNLIDTESERQIESEIIDIDTSALPSLQESTVSIMSALLGIHVNAEDRSLLNVGGTEVPEAFRDYLVGRGYLQRYEKLEAVDSAIAHFQRALDLDSRYSLAIAALGEAYWRRYEITSEPDWVIQATGNAQLALALNNNLGQVHMTLGQIYRGTGKYHEAYEAFTAALTLLPDNHVALYGLARTLELMGDKKKAEATFQKNIAVYKDYWAGYYDLAYFYIRSHRLEDATEPAEMAAVLVPQNAPDINDVGTIFLITGDLDRARSLFEQSVAIEPTYPAYSNIAYIQYINENYPEAARNYERALEINDHDHAVWSNLGNAYEMQPGKEVEAERAFRKAIIQANFNLRVTPNDPMLLSSLAQYHAMVGDEDNARRFIAASLSQGGDDEFVLVKIAFALEYIGDRKAAVEIVNKAIAKGYSVSELISYPGLTELMADSSIKLIP